MIVVAAVVLFQHSAAIAFFGNRLSKREPTGPPRPRADDEQDHQDRRLTAWKRALQNNERPHKADARRLFHVCYPWPVRAVNNQPAVYIGSVKRKALSSTQSERRR